MDMAEGGGNLPEDQQQQQLVVQAPAPPSLLLRRASISSLDECSQKCERDGVGSSSGLLNSSCSPSSSSSSRPSYRNPIHGSKCLEGLSSLQKLDALTDITLVAGGTEVKAHKNVLAACSPYFYAMFTGMFVLSSNQPKRVKCLENGCILSRKFGWLHLVSKMPARMVPRNRTFSRCYFFSKFLGYQSRHFRYCPLSIFG